jgi:hypothetical protein
VPTRASAADTPAQPIDSQALADAVAAAGHAPILQGTRPWRWRQGDNRIDLVDGREHIRHIDVADSRLALLSCGAALHHALVSLSADGWHALVSRLPDGQHPGHLAEVRLGHRIPIQPSAAQRLRTITARPGETGPAVTVPVDADKLRSLTSAVRDGGARLQLLRPDEVLDLVIAARHHPPTGAAAAPETDLLARSQDRTVRLAVLYGVQERRLDWLRAGEALSAVWTAATGLGLSVLPLHGAGEMAAAGEVMRRRRTGHCYPYLLLRFATVA